MSELEAMRLFLPFCVKNVFNKKSCKGVVCVVVKLPCSSNPCQNGGECVDDVEQNTYSCTCKEPFYGDNCESE